jgi:hypothetical protein
MRDVVASEQEIVLAEALKDNVSGATAIPGDESNSRPAVTELGERLCRAWEKLGVPCCRDLKCSHSALGLRLEGGASLGQTICDLRNLLDYAVLA